MRLQRVLEIREKYAELRLPLNTHNAYNLTIHDRDVRAQRVAVRLTVKFSNVAGSSLAGLYRRFIFSTD